MFLRFIDIFIPRVGIFSIIGIICLVVFLVFSISSFISGTL